MTSWMKYNLLFLMFFTANISAQKKQELKLQWTVAAELPVTANGEPALGFAGMVAGVHNNKLIIAGGANFPEAMPWNGGKKKYLIVLIEMNWLTQLH